MWKKMLLLAVLAVAGVVRAETLTESDFACKVIMATAGYAGTTTVTDLPVLVRLSAGSPTGFSYADCPADSVRFADADGNLIPHEIDTWNPSGESLIWVKIPEVSSSLTQFAMYYGGMGQYAPQLAASDVWSNYAAVWHLNETANDGGTTAAVLANSSAIGEAMNAEGWGGTTATNGIIGGARHVYSGSGHTGVIAAPRNLETLNLDALKFEGRVTLSAWVLHDDVGYSWDHIFYKRANSGDTGGLAIEMDNGSSSRVNVRGGDNNSRSVSLPSTFARDWTHITFAYEGSSCAVYCDGAARGTADGIAPATDNNMRWSFGNCSYAYGGTSGNSPWKGAMDEIRLSGITPTADYAAAEYGAMTNGFVSCSQVMTSGQEAWVTLRLADGYPKLVCRVFGNADVEHGPFAVKFALAPHGETVGEPQTVADGLLAGDEWTGWAPGADFDVEYDYVIVGVDKDGNEVSRETGSFTANPPAASPVDTKVWVSGLWQAKFNNSFDTSTAVTKETSGVDVVPGPVMADVVASETDYSSVGYTNPYTGTTSRWNQKNTTFAYQGWIWLEAGKALHITKNIDDSGYVKIDGVELMRNSNWEQYPVATFTPATNGWYAIDLRAGDGTGGKGPSKGVLGKTIGFGYNIDGATAQAAEGWAVIRDTGNDAAFLRTEDLALTSMMSVGKFFASGDDVRFSAGFTGVPSAAELRAYYGSEDFGDSPNGWPASVKIADISAGDTAVAGFKVSGLAANQVVRLALVVPGTDTVQGRYQFSEPLGFEQDDPWVTFDVDEVMVTNAILSVDLRFLGKGATSADVSVLVSTHADMSDPRVIYLGSFSETGVIPTNICELVTNTVYYLQARAQSDEGRSDLSPIFRIRTLDPTAPAGTIALKESGSIELPFIVKLTDFGVGSQDATLTVQCSAASDFSSGVFESVPLAVGTADLGAEKELLVGGLPRVTGLYARLKIVNYWGFEFFSNPISIETQNWIEEEVSPAVTDARVRAIVYDVGEESGAATAELTLAWGTDPEHLGEPVSLGSAVTPRREIEYVIEGLSANTRYTYVLTAVNNDGNVLTRTGAFTTGDPLAVKAAYGHYPASESELPWGHVVTFRTSDTETPYSAVPACSYTNGYKYVSSSTGQTYYFLDEADFRANAAARIGDACYLFVQDAVEVATSGQTIDVIRDDCWVTKTMAVADGVTVDGHGHTVRVPVPYVEESGFVSTKSSWDTINVFSIATGRYVVIRDMTIMGGGNRAGAGDTDTAAVSVAGILRLENVTVTRSNGGLYTYARSKTYLDACRIVRNCRYCGGGAYSRGLLVMDRTSLSENRSLNGSGGGGAVENQGVMYINNCVLCNNASTEIGGAINNYSGSYPVALYMINSTLSGNFVSSSAASGGGIGLRARTQYGKFYAVNSLVCNNYYAKDSVTESDIRIASGSGEGLKPVTYLYYNVYGSYSDGGNANVTELVGNKTVTSSAQDVFLDYYASKRVYQNANTTSVAVDGARLYSDEDEPLARYAPIDPEGRAVVGDEGVTTYFDASDWTNGVIRMSYRTKDGEMTAIGEIPVAGEAYLVTNFYESAFVPGTIERTIGIVGASGWVENDVVRWTLKLLEEPKNGTVGNITLFGDTYRDGTEVTVTATPEFACSFLGWYDANDVLVSSDAAYTFAITADTALKAKFSPPAPTHTFHVICEQTAGYHAEFPLTVTTNWLDRAFGGICPGGIVTAANEAEIENLLNAPDTVNGLNHVWMNYVLGGMPPGDPNGRIWIRADQTRDPVTLRMRMQELSATVGCGFKVRYRLNTKPEGSDSFTNGDYANAGVFDVPLATDPTGHYTIDLVFIPEESMTSAEYVTTVNTGAIVKVESAKKVEILATPWSGFSPTNNPAVSAAEYVKAASLTPGDRIYVYNRLTNGDGSAVRDAQGRWLGYYEAWKVSLDGATWQPIAVFRLDENGAIAATDQNPASAVTVPRGAGVWLERQDATKPIYVYGQLDTTPVTTKLERGWNLVGAPTGEAFDASRLTPVNAAKDHLVIPTGGAPLNCTYDTTAGNWGYITNQTVSIVGHNFIRTTRTTEGLTVPAGLGFWYVNEGAKEADLEWRPQTGPEEVRQ